MYCGIHEECGVFGIYSPDGGDVARMTYYGLTALQHRGQESAGIAVNRERTIVMKKELGLVSEVFDDVAIRGLGEGSMAVGHVRYSTSGRVTQENAQPMLVKHVKGQLALCHNGNLVNSAGLRRELELKGCIFHTTSDTEVISYIITGERIQSASIEEAVCRAMYRLQGAYSLVLMSPAKLIAARDPLGFKPLCYGTLPDGGIVIASESCALAAVGARLERELLPGEIMVVDASGIRFLREHAEETGRKALCIFEYIYFSRPDSVIEGKSVHGYRSGAGRELAREYPAEADVVIGVPDSGLDAAKGFSGESGIPYEIGLIKNKYIGRSFIAPSQNIRRDMVRLKLGAVEDVIRDKRVVLIDDSIVRGTTSAQLIRLVRDAGAKEVHMRISSPPFVNPCYYGTDIDSRENLIACRHTVSEICEIIGADSLGFLSLESARGLCGEAGDGVCCACFDGCYPTAIPQDAAKERFEA